MHVQGGYRGRGPRQALLIGILGLLAHGTLCAQQQRFFRHFTMADGLPDREVTAVAEDGLGFLWVGTNDGLARFDGREWQVFRHVRTDARSVCGNAITTLVPGNEPGAMWVGTGNGRVCRWAPEPRIFIPVTLPDTLAEKGRVLDLLPEGDAALLVSIEKLGLHRLDLRTGQSSSASANDRRLKDRVLDLCRVNGSVYAGTLSGGLMQLEGGRVRDLSRITAAFATPGQTIACIHRAGANTLWMGAWDNGLYKHVIGTGSVTRAATLDHAPFSQTATEITAITWAHGHLWLGTKRSGLYLLDTVSMRFTRSEHHFPDRASLTSNTIHCLFTDSRGMVWIGTDNGLDLYDPSANLFSTHWLGGGIAQADLGDRVTGIVSTPWGPVVSSVSQLWAPDGTAALRPIGDTTSTYHSLRRTSTGTVLLGTDHGLQVLQSDGHRTDAVRGVSAAALAATSGVGTFSLPSSRINAIAEAQVLGRSVWVVSVFGYGIGVIDTATRQGFIEQVRLSDAPFENMFNGFFTDSRGTLWLLGRNSGIARGIRLPGQQRARSLLDGSLPCAGNCTDGGYLGLEAEAHYGGPSAPKSVTAAIELGPGDLLLASADMGLVRFRPDRPAPFDPIPSPHDRVEGMARDAQGRIWCVAAGGLDVYDPDAGTWLRIDPADGLPEKGVLGPVHVLAADDFAVGSFGGIVRFDPASIQHPPGAPTVRITHLRLFDREADSLLAAGPIRLHHTQNFLRIAFTSFAFGSADKHRYHWQLVGVDPGPVDGGSRTEASYTNLKGGDLRFLVWAVNSAGRASTPVELAITIVPPFWERWWFFALIATLIAGAFYGAYRYRIAQLQHMQQLRLSAEIEAQEKERKRIARDLHDDLGTRISTLKLYLGGLRGYLVPGDEARAVERNAVEILDASVKDLRDMLNDLSPDTVSRYGYVHAVEELARHISNSRVIEVDVAVAGSPPRMESTRELALYRITQELFNNSIKHSGCTRIHVRMLHAADRLEVLYEDNGKGMVLSGNGGGHGLRNITNRLQLIGGTITWDSAPDQGLRAIIHLPT